MNPMLNRMNIDGRALCTGLIATVALVFACCIAAMPAVAAAEQPPALAYLGTYFQNDNAGLEPTTDADRARVTRTGEQFAQQLMDSGKFRIAELSAEEQARVAAGQQPGECGGCEIDYGKAARADIVAWIKVQKVSNLILNMNVYMLDVASGRQLLVKSVDLRGNTDDSWSRSLKYLVKNLVLPAPLKPSSS
jgi:hypothetical protein